MAGFVLVATPMIARLSFGGLLMVAVAGAAACGGIAPGEPSSNREPSSTSGGASTPPSQGSSGASGDSSQDQVPPGVSSHPSQPICCAPDAVTSGTMYLGGVKENGTCAQTSDFWCSTNWRIEKDKFGCPAWVYDVRKPAPDENQYCLPQTICTPGAYVFCRCADASEATKLCKDDGTFGPCGPCP